MYDIKNARAYHRASYRTPGGLACEPWTTGLWSWSLSTQPDTFCNWLAHHTAFPVPRHVVESYGENWTEPETIVTNGPFLLKSWQPGQSLILVRNPHYHGRFRGNVTQLEANFMTDWPTRLAMYEADELDSCDGASLLYRWPLCRRTVRPGRARQRHTDDYVTAPGWQCSYLAMNVSQRPFDDLRVRRALALASHREALADAVFLGEKPRPPVDSCRQNARPFPWHRLALRPRTSQTASGRGRLSEWHRFS